MENYFKRLAETKKKNKKSEQKRIRHKRITDEIKGRGKRLQGSQRRKKSQKSGITKGREERRKRSTAKREER